MFRVFGNAWKIPEIKKKILFTALIIVLYRLGSAIPVPYINGAALKHDGSGRRNTSRILQSSFR